MRQRDSRKSFIVYDPTIDLRPRVERAAKEADLSRSQWIRRCIRETLDRQGA